MKTALQELIYFLEPELKMNDFLQLPAYEKAKSLLQKEKQQIIDFAVWFNNNDNSYKSYEEIVNKYYNSTFEDNPEAGI